MKKIHISVIALLLLIGFASSVVAEQRFVFSKPEYKGRLIDNETKEPIEGVVVVAAYREEYSFCLSPGGCNSCIINVRETLTNKNGEFFIKPYTTWMGPFGFAGRTDFIIYKPGYASYSRSGQEHVLKPLDIVYPEYLFSQEIGTSGEVTYPEWHPFAKDRKITTYQITFGIVEMPKIYDEKQRLRASPGTPSWQYRSQELPLLLKAINEENKRFGLGEEK